VKAQFGVKIPLVVSDTSRRETFWIGDFSELKDGIYSYFNLEYEYLGTLVQLWG